MLTRGGLVPTDTEGVVSDLSFQLDDFRRQKVLYDGAAYAQMSKRLMLMRKGDFPSDPDMGVHIGKYRFMDMDTLQAGSLRQTIIDQHNTYIPSLTVTDVNISSLAKKGGYVLYIVISCVSPVVTEIDHAYIQANNTSLLGSIVTFERPKLITVE